MRPLNRDFVATGAHTMQEATETALLAAPKKKETTMANKLNLEMGVIFDEIQIEEVIAPRL